MALAAHQRTTVTELSDDVEVPAWAFKPDGWSDAFLKGLSPQSEEWGERKVWEVGVGTGINLIKLAKQAPQATFYFSDYDARCVPLARQNISAVGLPKTQFRPLFGSWDLVKPAPGGWKAPTVDIVFACIPQVPATTLHKAVEDEVAHYYDPKRYDESTLHCCGLGLNEALLKQARGVLTPEGTTILNLGGRPGIDRLFAMFQSCGYTPQVLHEEVVAQHAETSLLPLAQLERAGNPDFEFFTDIEAQVCVNARTAEERRREGLPLFHKIYVIAGSLRPS